MGVTYSVYFLAFSEAGRESGTSGSRIHRFLVSVWNKMSGSTISEDPEYPEFVEHSEWEEGDWPSARARPDSLEALVRATRFSRAELKRIYRSFKAHCPSGLVTEDSFRSIYSQFFPQGAHTHAYVHYLFHNLDQANKGTLSFQDMACGLSILCRGSAEERLRWVFKLYDLNGDGRVSREEMAEVVSAVYGLLGHGPHPPHQYLNTRLDIIFQKMDRNKDGVVTLDEFLESCLEDASITNSLAAFDSII
ncbi:Kv channel-interacting protein 1 [Halyomorpha halys]|uniref:Kv channel-interacting protein 1 n=1 Tax=Halyomorpha halys TaxID=286706 RepID=UPI0006D4DE3A